MLAALRGFPANRAGLIIGTGATALLAWGSTFNPFHLTNAAMLLVRVCGWASAGVLFLLLLWRVAKGTVRIATAHVVLSVAILAAPFFLSQPIFSGDLYAYVAGVHVARLGNPYIVTPGALEQERILQGVAPEWRHRPSAYGPLWQGVSRVMYSLSHSDVATVTVFRFVMYLALLGTVWIISRYADAGRALLFGASPFVLVDAIGDAHNDMLVAAALCVAVVFAHKPVRAGVAFAASVAIKFLPIIVAPALIVGAPAPGRRRLALWMGIATVAFLVVTFVPFWAGSSTFTGLQLQGQLFGHPLFAPQFLVYMGGYIFGSTLHPEILARAVGAALFVLITGGACFLAWYKKLSAPAVLAATVGAYLFFGTPYLQTWYLLWIMPVLCLLPLRQAVRWTSVAGILWVGILVLLPSHFLAS